VTTSTTVTNTVTVTSAPQQKRDGNAARAVAACTTVGSPSKIPLMPLPAPMSPNILRPVLAMVLQ
jgi:hypothetical protein